jgi:hypothetical protein
VYLVYKKYYICLMLEVKHTKNRTNRLMISLFSLLCSFALNAQTIEKSKTSNVSGLKQGAAILPNVVVTGESPVDGSCPGDPDPCQGQTFTQGGWGAGNSNPASTYLSTSFNAYFPNGLTIGCGSRQLRLTSTAAVFAFLPSGSTPNSLPTGTLVNPGSSYSNVLAGQLVALTLNMVFDANNVNFSPSASTLSNYTITTGTFAGLTVGNFLNLANAKIGSCGSSPYSFSQFNDAATAINENYNSGDNNFLVCPPPCNVVATSLSGSIACFGGSTNVTITASGGTAPYSGTGIFSRTAGIHSFTVTDNFGCSAIKTITLGQPTQLISSASNGTIQCFGGTTTVCINASGGTAPYNGTGTFSRPAGVHSFTVTDNKGCTSVITRTLTQPNQLTLTTTNGTIQCFGGSTTLNVSASGGTAPYTGTGTFTRLAGTHSFTVTDSKGCSAVISRTVTQPSAILANITASNGNCNNNNFGSATVTATGGTTPYSYLWSNNVTSSVAAGLTSGNYTATLTDANACSVTLTTTVNTVACCNVTNPGSISGSTASCGTICNISFGSIAPASGGIGTVQYLWIKNSQPNYPNTGNNGWVAIPNSNSPTLAVGCVTATTYFVRCARNSGCTQFIGESNMLSVVVNPNPTANVISSNILCNGGTSSASVSASGGTAPYTGTGVFTLNAGPYSYTVTDANGCASIVTGTITQPSALIASATNGTINCNGGTTTVNISATGGIAPYSGTGLFTRPAGTHTFLVTDGLGCSKSITVSLTQPTQLIAVSSCGTISCNGGTTNINVGASGGTAPYSGTGSFAVSAGIHSFTVTDAKGCSAVTSQTVSQPNTINLSANSGSISCFGGTTTVNISATGGIAPYSGTGLFTRPAGTHTFLVTDGLGCSKSITVSLTQPTQLIAVSSCGTISCNGGTTNINVGASGGTAPYSGTGSFAVSAGIHSFTVTDAKGCSAVTSQTVSQPNTINLSANSGSISCFGGTTTVNISATGGIAPYSGTGLFTRPAGTHTFLVTDGLGCSKSITVSLTQPTQLIAVSSCGTISCNGGTTNINVGASGGTAPYSGIGTFSVNAGPYSYTVTDANGCSSIVSGTITQPSALIASANAGTIACGGTTTVVVTAAGGTAPYSGIGTFSINAGPYSYTVTDANGCTSIVTGTITQASALIASANAGTINCNGGTTTVNISANGGTAPYSGIGTFSVNAGPYSYTVTDANGCTSIVSGTITQPSALIASANAGTINCNGGTTTVNISANGGTAPYSGIGTFSVNAGPYSYTVTDANGCTSIVTGTITQASALIASANAGTINCNGGTTTLVVTAAGGTAPYSGIGTFSVNAGPYSYTVTDANGCASIVTGTITQPSALIASANAGTISCNGGTTNINVGASGGTAPYSGIGTFSVNAGPYSYTVSDANGCTSIVTGTITQPSALIASATNGNINCNGGTTTLVVTAAGGTAPYSGIGTFSVNAGPFSYTVTDANGCSSIVTGTITQPSALIASATNGNINCNGGTTTLVVTANGGTAPYSGVGTFSVNAGPYSYTVTDANGCASIVTGTITQPSALIASATNGNINCNGGTTTLVVTAAGGTAPYSGIGTFSVNAGPYSYTVTDANGCTSIVSGTINQPSALIASATNGNINCNGGTTTLVVTAAGGTAPYSGIGTFSVNAGPYSYTVTDANGCSSIVTGTITQPSALIASATNGNINCNGGTTTLVVTAAGGTAPYSGIGTFSVNAGPYSYTVTDANGCTSIVTGTITQPSAFIASANAGTINCNGGTTTLVVTAAGGTAPYSGVGTFSVNAGPYSYTVTDANGCASIVSGTITQPSALIASANAGTINCNGGTTTLVVTAAGGTAPYSGIGTFSVNAGPYSYTVTDANGCTSIVTGTITQPSALIASATNGNINCNGGTTTLVVTAAGGTAPYSGIGTFSVNAGPYSYTVTDANGCASIVSGTITQPSALIASANAGTIACGGTTTLVVTAAGGTAPYSGIGTFSVNAGPYSYTVSDANGCTSIVSGTITQPSALIASANAGTINCNGGTTTVNISANGGTAPYSGIGTFSVNAGPYSYTVTDANGCTSIVTGTITQPSALIASATNGNINCNGGTTTLVVTAAGGTAPYSGIGTFSVNAGPYSYTVTDANGCTSIVTGTITQPSALIASATNGNINCNGGTTTLVVTAAGGTAPYSGIGTFSVNAGPYSYTVTDANGCTSIVSGTINQPSALIASATNGNINCNGGTTTLVVTAAGGTAPYSGIGTFSVNAGPYSYTVTDANGCSSIVTGTITQPSALIASATNGNINCNGGTTTLVVTAAGGTAPYSGVGTFSVNAGPYSYTVTDANGCTSIVTGTITQPSALIASATNGNINCNGGTTTINISANGGTAPYSGVGTFSVNAGPYSYTVTDANGCTSIVTGTITQPSALIASATNGTINCNGGTTTLVVTAAGGTAPYSGIGTFSVNAGPYSYTVTDANGCTSIVTGTITQSSALIASATNDTINCNGGTTTINISANGGTAPYSGIGTFSVNAGPYSYTVTDANGCASIVTGTITQPSALIASATNDTINCNGGTTTINISANGGTAPYSGIGTFSVNAGPYSYTVTDANGCASIVTGTITQSSALIASATNDTINCNGGTTTINISANGGTAPYSGVGTFSVNAGPYSYTVTDANGCTSIVTGNITQPSALIASATNDTINCNGGTTTINISANGGTAPYSGVGTFSVNAGPYSYTVTDANGCTSIVTGTITQPSALIASATNDTINCNGGTTTINISANGGTAPYSGVGTFSVNAGPYSYTVTDANGCTSIVTGTITQPSALIASANAGTIACGGTTTVVVTANGGTAPYSGIGTFSVNAGPYSYTVTDANGCASIVSGTITQPSALIASANAGTINCNGGTTTVNISANGGTAPYSGIGTFSVNAGPYSYTVTDANGCTSIVTGTITQPSALIASATNGNINCNGGTTTLVVTAAGGTAPYSGIGTFSVNAGPYSYTVTDANGCTSIVTGTITQPSALIASATNGNINCNGGTTTLVVTAAGGTAPYSGIGTFSVNAGPYSYTVTDANGCTSIVTGTITQPSALIASATNDTINCNGGTTTINISANGGTAPYSGVGTFSVNAGPYSYTVTDANGCSSIVTGTITQPSALIASATNDTINCNGGTTTINISANGGTAPYSGVGTFSVNAGPYSYTVTDANGCTSIVTGTINQPSALIASATNGNINCNGGTTTLVVTAAGGTAPYSGIGTFSVNAGPYSYTVTDANGCTSIVTGTITQPSALIASATNGNINCNGGTTTLVVTAAGGTAPYSGIGTFSVNAGPYSYTVTDANGCSSIVTGTITQPSALIASATNDTINCNGGTTTLVVTANGGTTPYSGVGTFSVNAGPYSYTVTDANGCASIVSGTITQPSALIASATNGNINCNGGTTTINISANGGTAPYSGVGTFSVNAGPYSYTVTDANGCTSIVTGTITQPSALIASATNDTINCNGGTTTINISANGGTAPYSGIGTFSVNAGPYSYTVTDANGCASIVSGTITQPSALIASANAGTINCNGGTTTVNISANGGTAPYSGIGTFSVNAGPYSYTVSDANGCTSIVSGTITQPSALIASANADTINCNGGTTTVVVTAAGGTAPYSGIGTFSVNAGPYSYTVTDANGCSSIVTGTITQPSALIASANAGTINCNGGTTTVVVTANGGTAPYSGLGTFSVNAGPYSYTVTDANGCSSIVTGTITQPSALIANANAGTINCNGGTTTVVVTAAGGTAPYSGIGTFSVNAGPYSYTVTDANGCSSIVTGTITQPSALIATATNGTINCNGGTTTVVVTAAGGTAPYSGIGTFSVNAGPYSYTVTDANGCSSIVTGTITQPSALIASATNDTINCNGGTTTINVSANGGTAPYSGLGTFSVNAGPYSYTVTDANGCTSIVTGTITQPSALIASATNGTINCNGGTTTVNISATGSTAPYSGIGTFSVNAGPYSYTVTDANGCSSIVSGTITQPSALIASANAGIINCNGGTTTVVVTAAGGTAPYSGIGTFSVNAGPFSYTVTDANGCTSIVTGTITQPSALIVSATNGNINCNGGTTTLSISASGGTAPYGGTGVFNVSAGSQTLTIIDAQGCIASTIVSISQPAPLSINFAADSILCNGGSASATITASGGTAPYGGTGTFNVSAGTQTLTIIDAQGCTASITVAITEPSPILVTVVPDSILCNGYTANVSINASGGTAPYNGTGILSSSAGTHTYVVSDANLCSGSSIILLTEPSPLIASFVADSVLCNGGSTSVTITATGGTAPYSNTGVYPVSPGVQSFQVSDNNGCTSNIFMNITEPLPLEISVFEDSIRCFGGFATLVINASGGTMPYSGVGTFTALAGNHNYVVTDTNGCTTSTLLTITQSPPIVASSVVKGNIRCHGDLATVKVLASGGNGSYLNLVTDSMPCMNDSLRAMLAANGGTVSYSGPGTYKVPAGTYTYGVIDSKCCWDTATIVISEPPPLVANGIAGPAPCLGAQTNVTITATGGTSPYANTGVFPLPPGVHSFKVLDANSCMDSVVMVIDTAICTGFAENSIDEHSVLVYPNPNNGSFKIAGIYEGRGFIMNQSGQLVKEIEFKENEEITIENMAKGLYFLVTPELRMKIVVLSD